MRCGGRQCLPREPGLSRHRRAACGGHGPAAPGQDVAVGVRILPLAVAAPDRTVCLGEPGRLASPSAAAGGTAAAQVLALINQARSAAGLPALTITSGLETSSSQHNLLMADGCGLSHQCPGEAPLGDRETAAGVDWTPPERTSARAAPWPTPTRPSPRWRSA